MQTKKCTNTHMKNKEIESNKKSIAGGSLLLTKVWRVVWAIIVILDAAH